MTLDNVKKKLIQLQLSKKKLIQLPNRCYLCGEEEEEEMVSHLLLHCKKSQILWDLILALFEVQWVMVDSVANMLQALKNQGSEAGQEEDLECSSIQYMLVYMEVIEQICFQGQASQHTEVVGGSLV